MSPNKLLMVVGLATLISFAAFSGLRTYTKSTTNTDAFLVRGVDLSHFAYVKDFDLKVPAFREWIVTFNRQYSPAEVSPKFKVWSDNYDIVQDHNAQNLSWTLGMNLFADLTTEEHAALNLGFDRTMMDSLEHNIEELDESLMATSIDWRSKKAVSGIKNQQQCGACWAFASAAALEGLYVIKKGSKVPDFSPQQLVDCSSSYGNQGCGGGTMVATYQYTAKNGIELQSAYPYQARVGSCRRSASKIAYQNKAYKSVSNSYTQLQTAVTAQPVTVAVEADQSVFQLYNSGVISSRCGTNLDHAITAVGFTSSYWIVKNQWGTSWGINGYVQIAKGSSNVCGINSMASYPTA